jgi:hypothetical protein
MMGFQKNCMQYPVRVGGSGPHVGGGGRYIFAEDEMLHKFGPFSGVDNRKTSWRYLCLIAMARIVHCNLLAHKSLPIWYRVSAFAHPRELQNACTDAERQSRIRCAPRKSAQTFGASSAMLGFFSAAPTDRHKGCTVSFYQEISGRSGTPFIPLASPCYFTVAFVGALSYYLTR